MRLINPRAWRPGFFHSLSMALFGVVLATSSASAVDLKPPLAPFQAQMTLRAGGGIEMVGAMWHDNGLERREMVMDGEDVILITRPDQGSVFMISPVNLMAMQMSLTPEMQLYSEQSLAGLTAEAVGEETISGESTTKYQVSSAPDSGNTVNGFMWITDDNIAMKFEGQSGKDEISMTLAEVARGPVDRTLFEVPADYEIMKWD